MATLAPSLVRLRSEVDARWPRRSKSSDGWIGDAAHAATKSEHNPDSRGIVHALDITCQGIVPMDLVRGCIAHPAVWYVIFNRTIWSRTHGFKPQPYSGADPHTGHVHVSLTVPYASFGPTAQQCRDAENSTVRWLSAPRTRWPLTLGRRFGDRKNTRGPWRLLTVQSGEAVKRINAAFDFPATSIFTANTAAAVRAWQAKRGMPQTGAVGKREWLRLGL